MVEPFPPFLADGLTTTFYVESTPILSSEDQCHCMAGHPHQWLLFAHGYNTESFSQNRLLFEVSVGFFVDQKCVITIHTCSTLILIRYCTLQFS